MRSSAAPGGADPVLTRSWEELQRRVSPPGDIVPVKIPPVAPRSAEHPAGQTALNRCRARCFALGFDASLARDSVELVDSILDALEKARARGDRLARTADEQAASLFGSEAATVPLRTEIACLVRENGKLHAQLVMQAEEVEAARRDDRTEVATARVQVRDQAFLCSTLQHKVRALEEENAGLREEANRAFEQNGIVLPAGHEVRWHGRKERMEAHSPVPPASTRAPDGDKAEAGQMVPATEPAKLVRVAEAQLSSLLARVSAGEARLAQAETDLAQARRQVARRDAHIDELVATLSETRRSDCAGGQDLRAERDAAAAAIGQLSSQVDFLNARCTVRSLDSRAMRELTPPSSPRCLCRIFSDRCLFTRLPLHTAPSSHGSLFTRQPWLECPPPAHPSARQLTRRGALARRDGRSWRRRCARRRASGRPSGWTTTSANGCSERCGP